MSAMHDKTHSHLCKQLALLSALPVPCFDNNDTVFIMTFPSDCSQGRRVHSLGLSSRVEHRLTSVVWHSLSNRMQCFIAIWSREHTHRERKATGRGNSTWTFSSLRKTKKRQKELMMPPYKSHTQTILLLHGCLTPIRDYLENPAVLMLQRCRMGHHCGS